MPQLIITEELEKLVDIKSRQELEEPLTSQERGWLKKLYLDRDIRDVYEDMPSYEVQAEINTRSKAYFIKLKRDILNWQELPIVENFIAQFELEEDYEPPLAKEPSLIQFRFNSEEKAYEFFTSLEHLSQDFSFVLEANEAIVNAEDLDDNLERKLMIIWPKQHEQSI